MGSNKYLEELFSTDTLAIIEEIGRITLHCFISRSLQCLDLSSSVNLLRETPLTAVEAAYMFIGFDLNHQSYIRERNEIVLQESAVPCFPLIFAVLLFGR